MTNAFTTYKRLRERADEGIHHLIDFDGSIMTDSGGYQVLEFGKVDVRPEEMARFEEQIDSDIAIVLDRPTGLNVSKSRAALTVKETLAAAMKTKECIRREDIAWMLPIQGGRYIDLVAQSADKSSKLGFDGYALGSPVEVMKEYDFALLVRMIGACKSHLSPDRPFHLFGAGHPLIIPLAVALGCDLFDSASYMLYAKQDRYISPTGTIRLEQMEFLPCVCRVCSSITAVELKRMRSEERRITLARHNLLILKQQIEQTKQALWEGRLWEFVQSNSRNHPRILEAFHMACSESSTSWELGTPIFKDRGLFVFQESDTKRPEISAYREKLANLDLREKKRLLILPDTKTKPFLASELYKEVSRIVSADDTLVTFLCPIFGLVPAELSDIFPLSQITSSIVTYPEGDPILHAKNWRTVHALVTRRQSEMEKWLEDETEGRGSNVLRNSIVISRSYKSFKKRI